MVNKIIILLAYTTPCHCRGCTKSRAWVLLFFSSISRCELADRYADRQTVTPDELRVTQALVEEVSKETGHLGARIAALEEGKEGECTELGPTVELLLN